MRVAYGNTRFVILQGSRAIKIVRIRPLHALARIFSLIISPERRGRFREKYCSGSGESPWRDFWDGFYANRNEYWYYQESKDPRVMPTERKLLGGWIIIQRRGRQVTATEFAEMMALRLKDQDDWPEIGKPWQFCHHPEDGHIVLVDYGRSATLTALLRTMAMTA